MTPQVEFRPATAADAGSLQIFLDVAGLPSAGVDPTKQEFLLAFRGEELAGCAALEVRRGDALLRSVAVAPELRRQGLGEALVTRMLAHARAIHVDTVWLLTDGSEAWFAKRGFTPAERASVPPAIAGAPVFKACPASARCMRQPLE